jgi:hypothetical protein
MLYHFAHSSKEWLDFGFHETKAQACAEVDWEFQFKN